ncbi:c-type cytochrome [uncultured Devosia sp.]|uniref:c-type cytochrome n=1 Tax=uncultured Devosia sp. TaxID=211434 RepID=UPI0035C96B68
MKRHLCALAAITLMGAGAAYAQDAAAGETVFKKCQSCHDVGENAKNRMGPVLNGVVDRVAGTYEGYKYSTAMVDAGAGGLIWTPETLDPFLTTPRDYVPGTKMNYALKDATDRANVIAYLQTLSTPAVAPPAP